MSAAAVVRSACHALRRPLFPRAVTEAQPPRENSMSVRLFHTSDGTVSGKPAETNKATLDDGTSEKLDRMIRGLDKWREIKERELEDIQRRRGYKVLFVAGVLAAIVVKMRFFGKATKEEDKEI